MMYELHPLMLDRELRHSAEAWRRWRRGLVFGNGFEDDPFQLSGSAIEVERFREIEKLQQSDPLRQPLLRWLYRLLEQRAHREAIASIERALRQEQHVAEAPEYGRYTLSQLLRRVLTEAARRDQWRAQLLAASRLHSDAVIRLWEQRAEFSRTLGLATPDAMERACVESDRVAWRFLERSRDMAATLCRSDVNAFFDQALAREASEGWPRRLQLRTLCEWLDKARLLDGLRLDPGRFPEPIAPASYLRALARLGAAWVDATAPRHQPFVVAHDPYGLRRRTLGAVFASLPLLPQFLRRRLGLSTTRIRDQRRALAIALLIAARAAAARLLLRAPALSGARAFRDSYQELSERVFPTSLPAAAAGSLLRIHVDDDQRFAGLLLAAVKARTLIDEHDEDWFRNPRATEQLRSEAELSPEVRVTEEQLDASIEPFYAALAEAVE